MIKLSFSRTKSIALNEGDSVETKTEYQTVDEETLFSVDRKAQLQYLDMVPATGECIVCPNQERRPRRPFAG